MTKHVLLCCFMVLFSTFSVWSQTTITGTIVDSTKHQPIAFANITLQDGRRGTASTIEGRFSLSIPNGYNDSIYVSHVSYKKITLPLSHFKKQAIIIALQPNLHSLEEITVKSGENPAFSIIRQAISHKKKNDPRRIHSYQYISYNKLLLSANMPTRRQDSLLQTLRKKADTTKLTKGEKWRLKFDSVVKATNFFLSESVTEKQVINPDKTKEKLLAFRVSGYKSPLFASFATEFQPFSFYDDNISLLGTDYLNPISVGTFNRYDFYLVDTTFYQADTVFVIQFQPKPHKTFNRLQGVISISVNNYAIKNVVATSVDPTAKTDIRIQQNYELVEGHWFPVQLNTDLDFHEYKISGRGMRVYQRSFIEEIKINPPLKGSSFGDIKSDLTPPTNAKENAALLEQYRAAPLEKRESNTYKVMDSLLRKKAWVSTLMESIFTQRWPAGVLDFDMSRFVNLNNYESVRLGAGVFTNNRISRVIQAGGYYGYGIRDKKGKYGGSLKLTINETKDLFLRVSYGHDIRETGSINEGHLLGADSFREWISSRYDRSVLYKAEVNYLILPDVHANLFVSNNKLTPLYSYQLLYNNDLLNQFTISEMGISVRYTHQEDYTLINGRKALFSQHYPSIVFSYSKAITLFGSQNFSYARYDVDIKHQIKFRAAGKTNLSFVAGQLQGIAPYGKLYNGRGALSSGVVVDGYFQTMRIYEFSVTRYASLFLSHNFGNVLIQSKYSKPELAIYHHMGVGALEHGDVQQGIALQSMSKGYFESGLGLLNLYRVNYVNVGYFGFGVSAFYRYGPYRLPSTSQNVVALLNFGFSF